MITTIRKSFFFFFKRTVRNYFPYAWMWKISPDPWLDHRLLTSQFTPLVLWQAQPSRHSHRGQRGVGGGAGGEPWGIESLAISSAYLSLFQVIDIWGAQPPCHPPGLLLRSPPAAPHSSGMSRAHLPFKFTDYFTGSFSSFNRRDPFQACRRVFEIHVLPHQISLPDLVLTIRMDAACVVGIWPFPFSRAAE